MVKPFNKKKPMRTTMGIEGGDYVVPLIFKACSNEVLEEGDKTDISTVNAAIHTKSGRYEN